MTTATITAMNKVDYSFTALRKLALNAQRQEELYAALHLALIVVFIGIMYALYKIRSDILEAIERK